VKKLTFAAAFALAFLMTPAAHAGLSVAVPEPGTLMMLAPGVLALGGMMLGLRRKR
jgi:hypothetical protein